MRKDVTLLERVQRRVTRMIENLKCVNYENRLKLVNLTTLETRRVRADLLETFKILKGFEFIDINKFFELHMLGLLEVIS